MSSDEESRFCCSQILMQYVEHTTVFTSSENQGKSFYSWDIEIDCLLLRQAATALTMLDDMQNFTRDDFKRALRKLTEEYRTSTCGVYYISFVEDIETRVEEVFACLLHLGYFHCFGTVVEEKLRPNHSFRPSQQVKWTNGIVIVPLNKCCMFEEGKTCEMRN